MKSYFRILFGIVLLLCGWLCLSLTGHAQTAKVIALSADDAREAELLYKQRDMINQRIEELRKHVEEKYLMEEKPGSGGFFTSGTVSSIQVCAFNGSCPPETPAQKKAYEEARKKYEESEKKAHHLERKQGWFSFEFSEDFKFVVPVANKFSVSQPGCTYWGGGTTIMPAYGSIIAN